MLSGTQMRTNITQREKVLKHLKEFGKITSMEAFEKYRITRVGAVIDTLRKLGHSIKSVRPDKGNYVIYTYLTYYQEWKEKKESKSEETGQTDLGFKIKKKYEWPD